MGLALALPLGRRVWCIPPERLQNGLQAEPDCPRPLTSIPTAHPPTHSFIHYFTYSFIHSLIPSTQVSQARTGPCWTDQRAIMSPQLEGFRSLPPLPRGLTTHPGLPGLPLHTPWVSSVRNVWGERKRRTRLSGRVPTLWKTPIGLQAILSQGLSKHSSPCPPLA